MADTMALLDRAVAALRTQGRRQRAYWEYYEGDQPLLYVTESVRNYFRSRARSQLRFVENWVSVVVASVLERIHLQALHHTNPKVDAVLQRLLAEGDVVGLSYDVHEQALATGEAYLIVWPSLTDMQQRMPRPFFQVPGSVVALVDNEDATRMVAAAKWWKDSEGFVRLTLYTPEALYRYRSRARAAGSDSGEDITDARAFAPYGTETAPAVEANPTGRLPVVRFQTHKAAATPEYLKAAPAQDMLNKTLADQMVTGEWGAFPQRYIVTNADLSQLESKPAGLWEIPAGVEGVEPTKVGQFDPADLSNYTKVIEHFVAAIAAISRVPSYYLRAGGETPSGEALRLMDSVLVHRAKARMAAFAPAWKQVARLMLAFEGVQADLADLQVEFADPAVTFPDKVADARAKNRQAGMPLTSILREEGKPEAFIRQVQDDLLEERQEASLEAGLAQLLAGRAE